MPAASSAWRIAAAVARCSTWRLDSKPRTVPALTAARRASSAWVQSSRARAARHCGAVSDMSSQMGMLLNNVNIDENH